MKNITFRLGAKGGKVDDLFAVIAETGEEIGNQQSCRLEAKVNDLMIFTVTFLVHGQKIEESPK